jgi:protein-S-isoprenylcysteine O-methyltransferase Ste14
MTTLYLFLCTIALEFIYVVLFVLTIKLPGFRFWPPPSPRSWQFFLAWFIVGIVEANGIFVGLLDFDSSFLPSFWIRLPIALVVVGFGLVIGVWAFSTFSFRTTLGLGDKLITRGPYQYTRNPQYIGDSLLIIGFMILTNSWMVWVIGVSGIGLNILAPFTEESWLEDRFGVEYLEYKHRVPRFIQIIKSTNTANQ